MIKLDSSCKYYLYWIHRKGHKNILTEGYIGITCDLDKRFWKHNSDSKKDSQTIISRALKKYDDIEYTVLCVGGVDYITELEFKLRPNKGIGWNINIGGDKPNLGLKRSIHSRRKASDKTITITKIDVIKFLIEYYILNKTMKEIAGSFNISKDSVSNHIRGKLFAYKDLDKYRKRLHNFHKKYISTKTKDIITEGLYNEILNDRDSGKDFKVLSQKYKISQSTIQRLCNGKLAFTKNFKSYRITQTHLNKLTYQGKTKTIRGWAKELSIKTSLIYDRIHQKMPIEKILSKENLILKNHVREITYKGETHSMAEWSRITGINYHALKGRLNNNWPIKEALTLPVNLNNRNIRKRE